MKLGIQMIGKLPAKLAASIRREQARAYTPADAVERYAACDRRVGTITRARLELCKRARMTPEQLEMRDELVGTLPIRPLNEPVVPDAKAPIRKSAGRKIARRFVY